ncbi:MAG: hypothetical protein WD226_05185 [Planctomycetota bacterium]
MPLDDSFQQYFDALDRAGDSDRCFLCRRTPAEVKAFFGFHEDGTPIDAGEKGLEDIALDVPTDIMSYRGARPVCAACQLNFDGIFLASNGLVVLASLLRQMEHERDVLWPSEDDDAGGDDLDTTR